MHWAHADQTENPGARAEERFRLLTVTLFETSVDLRAVRVTDGAVGTLKSVMPAARFLCFVLAALQPTRQCSKIRA